MKKRRLIIFITSALLVLTLFMAACSLPTINFDNCIGNKPGTANRPIDPVEVPTSSFTLTMIERDDYYYPTFEGKINVSFYPTKMAVNCAGEEIEIEPNSVIAQDGYYTFTVKDEVIFNKLYKGKYAVSVVAYKGTTKYWKPETAIFDVDDEYFGGVFVSAPDTWGDWDDGIEGDDITSGEFVGEVIHAMDKESNWTPFY